MSKRQVFFSFHYVPDNWRASQIRNMGKVSDSSTFCDNDWEEVKKKTNSEIEKWIDAQLNKRSCIVVLIGQDTSGRKWIDYEIKKAYELKKGIVGIYINNLKNSSGEQTSKGNNPFYSLYTSEGHRLSNYVTDYNPPYSSSDYVYNDIQNNIEDLIEKAIQNSGTY